MGTGSRRGRHRRHLKRLATDGDPSELPVAFEAHGQPGHRPAAGCQALGRAVHPNAFHVTRPRWASPRPSLIRASAGSWPTARAPRATTSAPPGTHRRSRAHHRHSGASVARQGTPRSPVGGPTAGTSDRRRARAPGPYGRVGRSDFGPESLRLVDGSTDLKGSQGLSGSTARSRRASRPRRR